MEKSYIIADFGSYTVEQNTPDYINNLKSLERERKNKRKKEDRQATIGAYLGCLAMLGIAILMISSFLVFGY